MKRIILLLALFLIMSNPLRGQTTSPIILSEVMFKPLSGDNEFVEIFNKSYTQSVNLNRYRIQYYNNSQDTIASFGSGTTLPPRSYAIILENDYNLQTGIYHNKIPASALILKITHNVFGLSGMSNSTDRPIRIINTYEDTLDTYIYHANNDSGYSDEKMYLDGGQSEWGNSTVLNGTPGSVNSDTKYLYDLSISSISVFPETPFPNSFAELKFSIKNIGIQQANYYSSKIFDDANMDSIPQDNELVFSNNYNNLLPGDSLLIQTQINLPENRNYNYIVKVVYQLDQDTSNNIGNIRFHTSAVTNYKEIVINEIKYAPLNSEPEWIEIYNRKDYEINIKDWKITDGSSEAIITNSNLVIPPKGYLVLSKDSTLRNFYSYTFNMKVIDLFNLSNTGDKIILKDFRNSTSDSANYNSSWGGSEGKSLERIFADSSSNSQSNWASSISNEKGSPGKVNSITPKNYDLALTTFSFLRKNVVSGTEAIGEIIVKNIGLNYVTNYNIEIYYDSNKDSIAQPIEKISTISGQPLTNNEAKQYTFTTNNYIEGANYYIAKIKFEYDADTLNNTGYASIIVLTPEFNRNDLVINEIMYYPSTVEKSEWIEIYNNSNKTINLNKFKIADAHDTLTVINNNLIINPASYLVIAKDSIFYNQYDINNAIIGQFPTLNNDADKVILIDSLDRVIDSLQYNFKWGGVSGYSLERFAFSAPSIDSANWKSTLYLGGTPGSKNSIVQKDYDAGIISFNYEVKDTLLQLNSTIMNYGKNPIDCNVKIYEDNNLDSLEDSEIANFNLSISAKESVSINCLTKIPILKKGYIAKIFSSQDEDSLNNSKYLEYNPGLKFNSIVINEIMFSPEYNRPEWIELANNTNDTITLSNVKVEDKAYNSCIISGIIEPNSYIVITKDSSINNYYNIPKQMLVYGNLPILNNDEESIVITDRYGNLLDSVYYNFKADTIAGRSLERFNIKNPSGLQANWGLSKSQNKGTPGKANSISRKAFDLEISKIIISPDGPEINSSIKLKAVTTNIGTKKANSFTVQFYVDMNNDSIPELLLGSRTISELDTSSSITIDCSSEFILQGVQTVKVEVVFPVDENAENNILLKEISPITKAGSVVISEIMCNTSANKPKWIELYFNIEGLEHGIDIKDWKISVGNKKYNLSQGSYIAKGKYLILASDTSFRPLYPNVQDVIIIKINELLQQGTKLILEDQYGVVIDSISYSKEDAKYKDVSIERRFAYNTWHNSISPNGSTPGEENSIIALKESNSKLIINEIMYEPGTDNNQFVEIFNDGQDSIDIAGCELSIGNNLLVPLKLKSLYLPSKKYYLFCADTLLFQKYKLNNYYYRNEKEIEFELPKTESILVLKDFTGKTIDSIYYSKNSHKKNLTTTKNRSLERIDPSLTGTETNNWSSSADPEGATPGKINSINLNNLKTSEKINIQPNPFSPDNDGFEDFTEISYNLSQPAGNIILRIFDNVGRLARTINTGKTSPASGSIIFDGLDENGKALRIGMYILLLEATNLNGGSNEIIKTVFVVARKL